METVTRYKAGDGVIFDDPEKCQSHESLCGFIAGIMSHLGESSEAVKGDKGWLQHAPEIVIRCRRAIMRLCRDMGMDEVFPVFKNDDAHPMSAVGRILGDTGGPLAKAWYRFGLIDPQGREFGQPFFAINGPGEGQACIEDRTDIERDSQ